MKEPLKRTELRGANLSVLEPPLFALPRSHGANLCVFEPPLLCHKCRLCPTPLLLAQGFSIANDSTMSFPPLSLADNATFFTPPFSNNHPSSHN